MEEERKNSLCPSVHCDQQEETEGREDGSLFLVLFLKVKGHLFRGGEKYLGTKA